MTMPFSATKWLLAGFCYFVVSQVPAAPLIVVGTPEPPFKMREGGQLTGIDVQVMHRVLDELQIEHEFRLINSGARMLREVSSGHVDVVLSLSYSPERVEILDYPERSYKEVSWHFFIREGDTDEIEYQTLTDLKPWRIGAVRSWTYTPEFWEAGLDYRLVSDHRLLIDMLLTGRIDVAPLNTAEAFYNIQRRRLGPQLAILAKPLDTRPYYNVFVRQSRHPEMKRLAREYDRVIAELQESGFIDELYQHYLGRSSQYE